MYLLIINPPLDLPWTVVGFVIVLLGAALILLVLVDYMFNNRNR